MPAMLGRVRCGDLLARHILLLCAAGRSPTEMAAVLFCSPSSMYRTILTYREGTLGLQHDDHRQLAPPGRTAEGPWWPMWKSISTCMVFNHTRGQSCTMSQRSRRRSRTSRQRNTQRLPREEWEHP
jgi:hypothetical protein